MTGLVGMVAKRGGEVLGKVVAAGFAGDGSIRVIIRTPDGALARVDPGSYDPVTFHPADPAPSVAEREWTEANFTMWAKVEDALNDLRHDLRTTLGLRAEATDAEIVERVRGLVAVASFRPGAVVHAPDPVSGRWMPVQPEAAPADQMTADPPPARASGRRVKIAAQLARGELLPRSGRLSARESKRLEQQHRDAAVALRKAHDKLAYPLLSDDRKREETRDE